MNFVKLRVNEIITDKQKFYCQRESFAKMLPSYYEARIKLIDDLVHPGKIDFQSTLEWFQWVKKLAFDDASFSSTCCKGNVTR